MPKIKTHWKSIVLVFIAILVIVWAYNVAQPKSHIVTGVSFPVLPTVIPNLLGTNVQYDTGAISGTEVLGSGGWSIGSNGTVLHTVLAGTCSAITYTLPLAATSSESVDCAVPFVLSRNIASSSVEVTLPVTANPPGSSFGGIEVLGSSASTTAGYISFTLLNLTGVATSSFAQATTGVIYQIAY